MRAARYTHRAVVCWTSRDTVRLALPWAPAVASLIEYGQKSYVFDAGVWRGMKSVELHGARRVLKKLVVEVTVVSSRVQGRYTQMTAARGALTARLTT